MAQSLNDAARTTGFTPVVLAAAGGLALAVATYGLLQLGGKVTFLNEVEAARIGETNDRQVDRAWDIWKSQAVASGPVSAPLWQTINWASARAYGSRTGAAAWHPTLHRVKRVTASPGTCSGSSWGHVHWATGCQLSPGGSRA